MPFCGRFYDSFHRFYASFMKWIITGFVFMLSHCCPLWIIKCNQYSNISASMVLLSHKNWITRALEVLGMPLRIISYHYFTKKNTSEIMLMRNASTKRSRIPMNWTAWAIAHAGSGNKSTNHVEGLSSPPIVVITTFTNSLPLRYTDMWHVNWGLDTFVSFRFPLRFST